LSGSRSIAILDYGSGNIRSAQRALERVGLKTEVTSDFETSLSAEGLVVPGVGAFGSCMNQLRAIRGDELIKLRMDSGQPTLGICVGMQILFEGSDESKVDGLSILKGRVERLAAPVLPHIGWNQLSADSIPRILSGLMSERFYFVHSYAVKNPPTQTGIAASNYGESFVAAIEFGPLNAVQFHPEKSGDAGLQLLKNWAETL
jgi:glutamine amidotransferase